MTKIIKNKIVSKKYFWISKNKILKNRGCLLFLGGSL